MVLGRCMVMSGHGLRGVVGPKAPIVLGQNNLKLWTLQTSMMFWKPLIFTCMREGRGREGRGGRGGEGREGRGGEGRRGEG